MGKNEPVIFENRVFLINTKNNSYMFKANQYGHLEHLYFGHQVELADAEALGNKYTAGYGDSILYDEKNDAYCMNIVPQEFGFQGRGDYREPSLIISDDNGNFTLDLTYKTHQISNDKESDSPLPLSRKADKVLTVWLADEKRQLEVGLIYKVFYEEDVIVRSTLLKNTGEKNLQIRKLMSASLDLQQDQLIQMSFHGEWIKEMGLVELPVSESSLINGSRVGFSSSTTNPGYLLRKPDTTEDNGEVWGFNLIYTGNHYNSTALNHVGLCRSMIGIQPEGFCWPLAPGESFATPEAVLSYSDQGLNDLSHHFHDFINKHIVPSYWSYRQRPILINSWEGFMFDFNQKKLLTLANKGRELGCELFVLDDGWFKQRNNDQSGLGNYEPDKKKLPQGLSGLAEKIHEMGMLFGIWVEPESVSEISDLFKAHPDWAIHDDVHRDLYGRHQLLLDLSNPSVQDFLVEQVGKVIDDSHADYVKWDMNRQLAGRDTTYCHRYILGLYSVLKRIFGPRPQVLLESCSSGGNRFDLGMACFGPQIWTSDDTDAIERLRIQKNASYLYPQSMMGAHVSASPSAQALRKTPISTRFNVAAYGMLGYELNLHDLSPMEAGEVKRQIKFYKQHRQTFQFGRFQRYSPDKDHEQFAVITDEETIATVYRRQLKAAPGQEKLRVRNLPAGNYNIESVEQKFRLNTFGQLLNFALPVKVNTEGKLMKAADETIGLKDGQESYHASDKALASGIVLANVFTGGGYNSNIRIPLDNGSEMYLINKIKGDKNG